MSDLDPNLCCSFCEKPATDVRKLIAGTSVYICDECIDLCYGLIREDAPISPNKVPVVTEKVPVVTEKVDEKTTSALPTPREIKEHLDQYIVGQDSAKVAISVAVHNHFQRLANPVVDGVEIEKSNVLLIGPTGSGKTLIAQTIARFVGVPFAIADATSLTEAGYVGDDVESVITKLLQAADYDVEKAERGIVYIDEIDKKARRGETASGSRDVSGEGVQQGLLKILEGSEIFVPSSGGRKSASGEMVKLNTRNILFFVGGAFVGIDKIVEQEAKKDSAGIGFGAKTIGKPKSDLSALFSQIEPEHIQKYGLIPELVGRLPVIAALSELSEEQLVHVLTEPKNAVTRQFQAMFALSGIDLEFTDSALKAVAARSRKRKTGARGLRGVIEQQLLRTQFELPDLVKAGAQKIVITKEVIDDGASPEIIRAEAPALPAPSAGV